MKSISSPVKILYSLSNNNISPAMALLKSAANYVEWETCVRGRKGQISVQESAVWFDRIDFLVINICLVLRESNWLDSVISMCSRLNKWQSKHNLGSFVSPEQERNSLWLNTLKYVGTSGANVEQKLWKNQLRFKTYSGKLPRYLRST